MGVAPVRRSILRCGMRSTRVAVGTMLLLAGAAAPAAAVHAAENAKPRFVSSEATVAAERSVRVVVVGRDRDDVVRGVDVAWGETEPGQGLSACEQSARSRRADRRRRGKKERFVLSHTYAAPGDHAITVALLSGGCAKRAQQRSAPRTLNVHVE
jgi:hypothetical protein